MADLCKKFSAERLFVDSQQLFRFRRRTALNNELLAYDMACPIECQSNVRIEVDEEAGIAVCRKCGSTYDVFNGYGQPLSGRAQEKKYGLTSYIVTNTSIGYLISR